MDDTRLPDIGSLWTLHSGVYRVEGVAGGYVHLVRVSRPGKVKSLPHAGPMRGRIPVGRWPGDMRPTWPPDLDSQWDWSPDEVPTGLEDASFRHRVIGIERDGSVRLLDESQGLVDRIHRKDWPADFVPHYEYGVDPVLRAVLVGGEPGAWFQKLKDQAAEYDIDLVYHVPMKTNLAKSASAWDVPLDVDVMVLLVSHMGHGVYDVAKRKAVSADLPVVEAVSQGFARTLHQGLQRHFPFRFIAPFDVGFGTMGPASFSDRTWVWVDGEWRSSPDPSDDVLDSLTALLLAALPILVLL